MSTYRIGIDAGGTKVAYGTAFSSPPPSRPTAPPSAAW